MVEVLSQHISKSFSIYNGDSCEVIKGIPDASIHFSIFSPPFASLYVYTASDRDIGNVEDHDQFAEHMRFLIGELYRVMMPGRLLSFHCMNLPTSKARDGIIGLSDFRGRLIRAFEAAGFIYHSEVCIWKDPVTAMQRTKALGLLHKTIRKDSAMCRQGIPDYLVTMRKPGANPEPIPHTHESFPVTTWQKYASPIYNDDVPPDAWDCGLTFEHKGVTLADRFQSPIWMDINPSDTLQHRSARESEDERHICPLQLLVIQRAIHLWTNPGDVVLSPFAGIGSEGFIALGGKTKTTAGLEPRRFIGIELKKSYYEQARRNLIAVEDAEAEACLPFAAEGEDNENP